MNRGKIHSNLSNDWQTPADVFQPLHGKFQFTVDLAAGCPAHSRCDHYVDDLLNVAPLDFRGESCWINPPYGSFLYEGLKMVCEIARYAKVVAALLPMSPDLAWYHQCVLGVSDQYVRRGRIKFKPTAAMVEEKRAEHMKKYGCRATPFTFKNSPAHANLLAVYSRTGNSNYTPKQLPGKPTNWIRI